MRGRNTLRTIFSNAKKWQHVVENSPKPGATRHQTDAERGHRPAKRSRHRDVLVYASKHRSDSMGLTHNEAPKNSTLYIGCVLSEIKTWQNIAARQLKYVGVSTVKILCHLILIISHIPN